MKNKSQNSFGLQRLGFTVLRRRKESKEEQEEKEEGGGEEEDQGMESFILGFWYEFPWRIYAPFGLGFVQRSHKPLNCWGYESKTPIGVK